MFKMAADGISFELARLTLTRANPPLIPVPSEPGANVIVDLGARGSVVATSVRKRLRILFRNLRVIDNLAPVRIYGNDPANENVLTVTNSEFLNNRGSVLSVASRRSSEPQHD